MNACMHRFDFRYHIPPLWLQESLPSQVSVNCHLPMSTIRIPFLVRYKGTTSNEKPTICLDKTDKKYVCFFNNKNFQSHIFVTAMTYAHCETLLICKFKTLLCWLRREELPKWDVENDWIGIKLVSTILLGYATQGVASYYFLDP